MLKKLLANFTRLMAILLWAGGIMAIVSGSPQLGISIFCVNLINGFFSFFQEFKAEKATSALQQMLPANARVVRDGEEKQIPALDIVPGDIMILEEGDIINVDVSTILDGYYSDASRMFIIGKASPEKEKLVRVAKECLEIGMQVAKPYCFVGDIGHAIEKHAKKNGFSVVRDLCGHGVGLEFHEEPDVLHFGRKGTGMLLVPGMVFTIEPMINMGTWKVFIDSDDDWTVVTDDELPSAQWEHTFLMTEKGLQILTY